MTDTDINYDSRNEIGKLIKLHRSRLGISQTILSNKIREIKHSTMRQSVIAKYESGDGRITIDTIMELALVLGPEFLNDIVSLLVDKNNKHRESVSDHRVAVSAEYIL